MKFSRGLLILASLLLTAGQPARPFLPTAIPNDNLTPAGTLRDNVLTIALEATQAMWYPDGDSLPGLTVEAFAETGKQPTVAGPLVRVRAGTEIRAQIRNTLQSDTLTFYLPARIKGVETQAELDSIVILPGATGELRFHARRPGNYLYHANGRTTLDRGLR